MQRLPRRERNSRIQKEILALGIGAGFGVGYLIALIQHQAELTHLLSSL